MTTPAARRVPAGALLVAGFDGTEPSAEILRLIREHRLGGVILYGKNCVDAGQVLRLTNRLQEAARAAGHERPLLVAIDQEQGRVVRIREGVTVFPPMGAIARAGDPALVAQVAEAASRELLALGVNWNLAPVADVLSAAACPIGDRSFGADPRSAAAMVAAYVCGAARAGMLTCVKHFPGHGSTGADTHVAAPTVTRSRAELESCDLVPFRAAVAAGVSACMTTHITFTALDPDAPATLSRKVIVGLLRGELGFDGVVVADDLEMAGVALGRPLAASAADALRAGCDLLIVSRMLLAERDLPGLCAALQRSLDAGEVPDAAHALARVRRLREALAWRADPAAAATVLRCPGHLALLAEAERAARA
jgi:beta-N-acetylhexosaminidase